MKANKVFTSFGEVLTTEPDSDPMACISGDEISRVEVDVPTGTRCGICGKRIRERKNTEQALNRHQNQESM